MCVRKGESSESLAAARRRKGEWCAGTLRRRSFALSTVPFFAGVCRRERERTSGGPPPLREPLSPQHHYTLVHRAYAAVHKAARSQVASEHGGTRAAVAGGGGNRVSFDVRTHFSHARPCASTARPTRWGRGGRRERVRARTEQTPRKRTRFLTPQFINLPLFPLQRHQAGPPILPGARPGLHVRHPLLRGGRLPERGGLGRSPGGGR